MLLAFTGLSDFDGLHSRRHDEEVQLYAFDVLAMDGDDLRKLPLSLRKHKLARLLYRTPQGDGIFIADYEQGEIGPDLFRAACTFGLEGLVSKRADRRYRAGRSKNWVKSRTASIPLIGGCRISFRGVYGRFAPEATEVQASH